MRSRPRGAARTADETAALPGIGSDDRGRLGMGSFIGKLFRRPGPCVHFDSIKDVAPDSQPLAAVLGGELLGSLLLDIHYGHQLDIWQLRIDAGVVPAQGSDTNHGHFDRRLHHLNRHD